MPEVIKDERTVQLVKNDDGTPKEVLFRYDNQQIYTPEAARNLYVQFHINVNDKIKQIELFETQKAEQNTAAESVLKDIQNQLGNVTDISESQWNVYKKIQLRLLKAGIDKMIAPLKVDIENEKAGIEIWKCCANLPESEQEKKMKAQFEANNLEWPIK